MIGTDYNKGFLKIILDKINDRKCFDYLLNQLYKNKIKYKYNNLMITFNLNKNRFELFSLDKDELFFTIPLKQSEVSVYIDAYKNDNEDDVVILDYIKDQIVYMVNLYNEYILKDDLSKLRSGFENKLINQFDYYDLDFIVDMFSKRSNGFNKLIELDANIVRKIYDDRIITDIFDFPNHKDYVRDYFYNVIRHHSFSRYGEVNIMMSNFDDSLIYEAYNDLFNDPEVSNYKVLAKIANLNSSITSIIMKDTVVYSNKSLSYRIDLFNDVNCIFIVNTTKIFMDYIFKDSSGLDMFSYTSTNNDFDFYETDSNINMLLNNNVFFTEEKINYIKTFYVDMLPKELPSNNIKRYIKVYETIEKLKVINNNDLINKRILEV